ncbi:MAG: flagellar protein FlgN, partial [Pseudomonadota bacterium]
MKSLLDDLLKLLHKQVDLYKNLLAVLNKENEIILSASVEALSLNNKKKEVVILQIKLLDESCLKLVDKIYQKMPRPAGSPSLADLIEQSSLPSMAPLKSCYATLLSVARSVRELNIINERLIKGSL